MAEEIKNAPVAQEEKAHPTGNPNREPQGSQSAPRNANRKFGGKGKPGERRGGRGGFRHEQREEYEERVVAINRISTTTKGGKHMRFDALVVIGDKKGKYGFALRKSGEVPDAIKKALTAARKDMKQIHITKTGTIAHPVEGIFGSTKVVLRPAPEGTGIIAGGAVRAVVELAGLRNIVSKVYGSRTAINVIRATNAGLATLKEYDAVMVLRGKKSAEEVKAKKAAKAPVVEETKGE